MPCLLLCADDSRVWKLLQSHRDISTGSVETAELALYSARDVQIYCTESLYFSLYLMSIFETNSNKHSYSVFKASLVTLCVPRRAHAHAGARGRVRSLLPGPRGGVTKEVTSDFFRIRVERKAFPRVANE